MKAARFFRGIVASQDLDLVGEIESDDRTDPCVALRQAVEMLGEHGIQIPLDWKPETAVMVAEACNLAAKAIDDDFYGLKPQVIEAAITLGAEGGWGDDACFYLHTPNTGTACFHDPYGQICADGNWPHRWSKVTRQHAAFAIATNPAVRRLFAEATSQNGKLFGISDSAVRRALRRLAAQER